MKKKITLITDIYKSKDRSNIVVLTISQILKKKIK